MKRKEKEKLAAGARMIDDVELDRLWRLSLQGETSPAFQKLSVGGPKKVEVDFDGSPWRDSSEYLFGKKDLPSDD